MNAALLETIERLAQRNAELRAVMARMLDPDDLGSQVQGECRRVISDVLTKANTSV